MSVEGASSSASACQRWSWWCFLYLLFRVVIKRRVGASGMADMLVLVIVDGQV